MAAVRVEIHLRRSFELYHKAVVHFESRQFSRATTVTREYYGDLGLWREISTNRRAGGSTMRSIDAALREVIRKRQ